MATLWTKGGKPDCKVEQFTVGKDRELDLRLAKYDIIGSKAHIAMLAKVGLLSGDEEKKLRKGLDKILDSVENGTFRLADDVEDIHSQIEITLTQMLGEAGGRIHSGRSRNDQILVDIKLYLKDECLKVKEEVRKLFDTLMSLADKHKEALMPGYTHFQIAMPSSFGLWLSGYAECLAEDVAMLKAAYTIADNNPLGSAAGYGSSFPLDREMTTRQLGFSSLTYNSIAAQLGRGRTEKAVAAALSQIAGTLNRLSYDCCLFLCQNYSFISFPDSLATGSSIMPHKKNPDVWEMIRGNCNLISSAHSQICMLTENLPHGYHRDYQLLKEIIMPALDKMHSCLEMADYMMQNIEVKEDILSDPKYSPIFSVEKVNRLVESGVPFRQAYRTVAKEIASGQFKPQFHGPIGASSLGHTHLGSIGNLALDKIREKMNLADFVSL